MQMMTSERSNIKEYEELFNKCKELYEGKFDNILMADIPENKPRKFRITSCNEYMVDNSDFVICYIDHTWGGAYTTYKYARRKKKQIFNVAEKPVE